MRQKNLYILAGAAVAMAAVAAISLSRRDANVTTGATDSASSRADAHLFPALVEHVNDVDSVNIKRKDGEVTLKKSGDHWGVAEKNGFPIEMEPVRKMLIAMAEMTKLEPKTSDPTRYEQLGVQDPDAENSKSVLITLKDASGKDLAQLVLGKERESKGAALSNQRFVRKGGEAQSWLVQGTFDVKEKASDWLEKKVVEIKRDRVRSVEITQPDGELLAVDRPDAKTTDFTLVEIPEGKELTFPTAAGGLAGGLEYVNLEDVEPVEKIDFTANPGPIARVKTFGGLVVTVTMKDQDGKTWAKFAASYEAPPVSEVVKPADASAPEDPSKAADAKAPDEPGAIEAAASNVKTPEEVKKEVAELNERLSKWAFQISSYTRANLGKKKSEILKDKAVPVDPNAVKDPNAPDGNTVVLPDSIPPEIQAQIKAHQESIGHKVQTTPPKVDEPVPHEGGVTPEVKPVPKPDETPVVPPHDSRM